MFDLDQFINDCRSALSETTKAGVRRIHHSPDLTILNIVWGPMMTI